MRTMALFAAALFVNAALLNGQVITCDPAFVTPSDAVTVTFNADQGNMGLKDYTGDVYAHMGVITNVSSSWRYVVTTWGVPDPIGLMTRVSANVYTIVITPSIREFFGVPESETIQKLAFVFRNSDGSKEGKTATNGDIFYDVYQEIGLSVLLTQPGTYNLLVSAGEEIPVSASASKGDSLILLDNDVVLTKVTALTASYTITAAGTGQHKIVARAWDNNVSVEDSAFYYIKPDITIEDVPSGLRPGVNITGDNSAAFLLYAPGKDNVFVTGDFNNWLFCDEGFMKKSSDGKWFWLEISGLDPAIEYGFQYLIDGSLAIPDPYATKVLDPYNDKEISSLTYPGLKNYPEGFTDGLVSVFQTRPPAYTWKNETFTSPSKEDLVIYELLVRDFVAAHDFKTIQDSLDYFTRLGVNAIEFMPVFEFEGNKSWGYNPSMYFAVDKFYGPADSFKELIDSCHSRGIAVIMDMVLNHAYGSNPLVRMYYDKSTYKVTPDNPWFNVDSPNPVFSWGYDFNHESEVTKSFADSVCHYWLSEFKIDGFRYDFTKGFTNTSGDGWAYDASRIAILKRIGDKIWSYKPEAYLILEHFADNNEEMNLANYGFMLWGNAKGQYQEASMGYTSTLSGASYLNLGWSGPGLVDYMESHDEERTMYNNLNYGNSSGSYSIRNFLTALNRVKLCSVFFFAMPGPKMIWQFEEVGYDISNTDYGRVGEMPIHWDYYTNVNRRDLYNNFLAMIDLKKKYETFSSNDFTLYQYGKMKRLNIEHADMDVVVLGNFGISSENLSANFTRTGTWYEFFSGNTVEITPANQQLSVELSPGGYRLYTSKFVERPSFLVGINDPVIPEQNEILFKVHPNPFTESMVISFAGDDAYQPHTLEIFSADGALVRVVTIPAGMNEYTWNGRNSGGMSVNPGVYFIKLTSAERQAVKKVVMNR